MGIKKLALTIVALAFCLAVVLFFYSRKSSNLAGIWEVEWVNEKDGVERISKFTWIIEKWGDGYSGRSIFTKESGWREIVEFSTTDVNRKELTIEQVLGTYPTRASDKLQFQLELGADRTFNGEMVAMGGEGGEELTAKVSGKRVGDHHELIGRWNVSAKWPSGETEQLEMKIDRNIDSDFYGAYWVDGKGDKVTIRDVILEAGGVTLEFTDPIRKQEVVVVTEFDKDGRMAGKLSTSTPENKKGGTGSWSAEFSPFDFTGEWGVSGTNLTGDRYNGILQLSGKAGELEGSWQGRGEKVDLKEVAVDGPELSFSFANKDMAVGWNTVMVKLRGGKAPVFISGLCKSDTGKGRVKSYGSWSARKKMRAEK